MSVSITTKVAYELVKEAADLFYRGTGVVIEPMEGLSHMDRGYIDDLEQDSSIRFWANQLLFFARTVHGIFNRQLLEQDLLNNGEEI
jgi:predicted SPOUT superfamily RNA methylase MTH1